MKISGLILAAGNSKRLGKPKQLLQLDGQYLLERTQAMLQNCCDQVFTVLGANHPIIMNRIKIEQPIINNQWPNGMGTSLTLGLKKIQSDADFVLIALSDQPLIKAFHYHLLCQTQRKNPNKMVASSYANTQGVPASFPQRFYPDLLQAAANNQGAQVILKNNKQKRIDLACPAAAFDVDTQEDWRKVIEAHKNQQHQV